MAANIEVWLDEDHIQSKSLLDIMANIVENAALIILCISEGFKKSPYCRMEAEYAFKRKISYIFAKVEKD